MSSKNPWQALEEQGWILDKDFMSLSIGSKLVSGHPVWLTVDNSLRF